MTHSSYRTASSLPEVTLTSFITTASHSLTTLQPSPQVRTSQVAIIIHQYFHRQLCLCRPFPISFITTNTPSSSFLVCSTKPSNKSYSDPSSRSISTFIHYPPLLVPSTSLFLFFFLALPLLVPSSSSSLAPHPLRKSPLARVSWCLAWFSLQQHYCNDHQHWQSGSTLRHLRTHSRAALLTLPFLSRSHPSIRPSPPNKHSADRFSRVRPNTSLPI